MAKVQVMKTDMEVHFDCRDSSVSIAAGYGLDGRGPNSSRGKKFFSTP
jgi:hypothetical protein